MPEAVTTPATTTETPAATTTTVTSQVAASPTATTTAAPASGGAQSDWTSGLNDDLKSYVQVKGFRDPAAVVESYRGFEKLHGAKEHLVKLPENMDTPEGRAIWERLGRPKEAKDYIIDLPKDNADATLGEWLRGVADGGNFTQKQLDKLVGAWNERQTGESKASDLKAAQEYQAQEGNLKREWGAAFDQNLNVAKAGANALGLSKDDVDALEGIKGFEATMRLLHKLGGATGEHTFVTGQTAPGAGGPLAPAQAKAKIRELTSDKNFQARFKSGDADARRQWDQLNQQAAFAPNFG